MTSYLPNWKMTDQMLKTAQDRDEWRRKWRPGAFRYKARDMDKPLMGDDKTAWEKKEHKRQMTNFQRAQYAKLTGELAGVGLGGYGAYQGYRRYKRSRAGSAPPASGRSRVQSRRSNSRRKASRRKASRR